jgi:hypothetical protein
MPGWDVGSWKTYDETDECGMFLLPPAPNAQRQARDTYTRTHTQDAGSWKTYLYIDGRGRLFRYLSVCVSVSHLSLCMSQYVLAVSSWKPYDSLSLSLSLSLPPSLSLSICRVSLPASVSV